LPAPSTMPALTRQERNPRKRPGNALIPWGENSATRYTASQPATAMPGKMPMMKAGESPLETLKRILATPEKRLGPG
jgi:hypothetical protein